MNGTPGGASAATTFADLIGRDRAATTFADLMGRDRAAIGTWVKLPTIESVELMAIAGMDFVVIDLEHAPISIETAATLIAVARGRGIVPLVRLPDHGAATAQRCLDAGAAGLLVPHVDTVEQARAIGAAARFEPRGRRGVGPTSRAGDWGLNPLADYLRTDASVAVIAQIESREGAENAAAMLRDGAVDALFVGAVDLAVSLGRDPAHPDVTELIDGVLETCRAAGVPCGTALGASAQGAADRAAQGYGFVMVSNDATMLGAAAKSLVDGYRAAQ